MKKLFRIIIVLCLTTSIFSQGYNGIKLMLGRQINWAHPLSDFVGVWFFLEDSGNLVQDLSGNALNGTIVNSMPWTSGKFGPCLEGDGSEVNEKHILVPDSDLLSFGNDVVDRPFTILIWYKQTNNTGLDLTIMKGDNTANIEWQFYTLDGKTILRLMDSINTQYIRQISDSAMSLGWHQIVGTYNGDGTTGGIKHYLDGKLDPSTANTNGSYTAMHSKSVGLFIGASYNANETYDAYSYGKFDHVIIWDRVLSLSEIALLYRGPFCMFEDENIVLMEAAIPEPTVGGQVIIISKAAIPFIFVLSVILIKRRRAA